MMLSQATASPGSSHWDSLIGRTRLRFAADRLGKVQHWFLRTLNRRRLDRAVLEHIAGVPLVVLPGVLHPRLMRTGEFFAAALIGESLLTDADVLDLGTGSGICAIVAGKRAKRVTAVDLSRSSVRCAQINALLAGLEHKIEVMQGDLFAPLAARRFDLILFNPPFLRGEPRCEADLAWRSPDVAERFAAGLADHLTPSGSALLLLSTFGDAAAFLGPLAHTGFKITLHRRREFLNERLSLLRVQR